MAQNHSLSSTSSSIDLISSPNSPTPDSNNTNGNKQLLQSIRARAQSTPNIILSTHPATITRDRRSLPNIKLAFPRPKHKTYAERYAGSIYSDDDDDDNNNNDDENILDSKSYHSSFDDVASLLSTNINSAPHTRPVGAAWLSAMMYRRSAQTRSPSPPQARRPTLRRINRKSTLGQSATAKHCNGIGSDNEAEKRSEAVGSDTIFSSSSSNSNNQLTNIHGLTQRPESVTMRATAPGVNYRVYSDEDFNGMIAPGAFTDEKQLARAEGGRFKYFLLGGRQREHKLFTPTVYTTARGFADESGNSHWADGEEDMQVRRTVFCFCMPVRYCVALTFFGIFFGAIAGFFIWPRVPTVTISVVEPRAAASVVYDKERSLFGISMPINIRFELYSGCFYPVRVSGIAVEGFNAGTGNKVVETKVGGFAVKQLRTTFVDANATLSYLTSDMSDPALVDLFGKCAPADSGLPKSDLVRSGKLVVRFRIRLGVANLGWLGHPIVTLNQNIECPE